jgi:hypothetical protein
MNRQLYGVGNLVQREKFGIGSKLKKFVRNIIPNEVAEVAVKAAPFVAPFNPLLAGAMSAVGSFDQTGRIGSSIKAGLINYGLGQAARFAGGAGFQEGLNPFAGYSSAGSFGGIGSLFTSPIGTQTGFQLGQYDLFKPYSGTPTQDLLKTPPTNYTGGVDLAPTELTGRSAAELQSSTISGGGISPYDAPARSAEQLVKTYGTQPGTQPGYVDLIKQAGSLDPNVSLSQRFDAVKDLSQKALQDIYTKPVRNAAGEIVDRELDKQALISTAVTAGTYADALGLLGKAGDPDPGKTLSEAEYQRLRVDPEKAKFSSLTPEAFGIRNLSANGGIMDDMQSGVLSITLTPTNRENFQVGGMKKDMSNNRVSQIIQLIRDAEAMGNIEKAEELRLDLFRETKKANGGQITGRNNYLLGNIVKSMGVAEPTNGAKPSGLVFNMNEGGGGIGNLIKRVLQQVQPQQPRSVSNTPVNDLYKYYLENGTDEDYKKRIMESIQPRFGIAMGGEIPVKQNAAGVSELDMRAKGGFIPVGIKEKADDVPAMLSKNEFVFTADAVRGAGKGSINKGAQKMYKLMKSLEKKVNKQR